MRKILLCVGFAAVLPVAALAQPVGFRPVAPKFPEEPTATVYEASVRLAGDEVLVVRELRRQSDGRVYLTDAICDAQGMDATYRVTRKSAHGGTSLQFLSVNETVKNASSRTALSDTRLEIKFRETNSQAETVYAWFARVEKLSEVKRRYPGYTPLKRSAFSTASSGSRFLVPLPEKQT